MKSRRRARPTLKPNFDGTSYTEIAHLILFKLSLTISHCLFAASSRPDYVNDRLGHHSYRQLPFTIRKLQSPFCCFPNSDLAPSAPTFSGFATKSVNT